jgi:hypothetical protein
MQDPVYQNVPTRVGSGSAAAAAPALPAARGGGSKDDDRVIYATIATGVSPWPASLQTTMHAASLCASLPSVSATPWPSLPDAQLLPHESHLAPNHLTRSPTGVRPPLV